MPPKKSAKETLQLLHSDQRIMEILKASNEYLELHPEIREKIDQRNWTLRSLFDLMPETVENFWSGHIFPITEAEYELESSIVLCKIGFYKHAIASLRNVLEMGLLSVYWDIDDKAHVDIQNWLKPMESTPFRNEIFKRLRTHQNIKIFDDRQKIFEKTTTLYGKLSNFQKIFEKTTTLYGKLSNFSHTKGYRYSSQILNAHSNVNQFTEKSLLKWLELMEEVVEVVTIFHILKYPVGLQSTPIDEKFGLNGPIGGFMSPSQVEQIKKVISGNLLVDLQDISDHDENAVGMAEWVNSQPDITQEEFAAQIEKEDQRSIAMEGFSHWLKNQKKWNRYLEKQNPDEWKKQLEYWKKMRIWAKENGCLTKPNKDFFGNELTSDENAIKKADN